MNGEGLFSDLDVSFLDRITYGETKKRSMHKKPTPNKGLPSEYTLGDETVCGYKIGKILGEGSYGSVFEATGTRGPVALKMICTGDRDYESTGICEAVEIDILSRFKHPCLLSAEEVITPVSCPDFDDEIGLILPVMKSFPGDSPQILSSISFARKLRWCFDVACGIEFLHGQDIIHGDVKPNNFLFNQDYSRAVVADFGLSLHCVNGVYTFPSPTIRGTSMFISPEFLSSFEAGDREVKEVGFGTSRVTTAADVWAFGVSIPILFLGWRAGSIFKDVDDMMKKLHLLSTTKKREDLFSNLLSDFSSEKEFEGLIDLIALTLSPDPRMRITMQEVLEHPLFSNYKIEEGLVRTLRIRDKLPMYSTEYVHYMTRFLWNRKISTLFLAVDLFYQCKEIWNRGVQLIVLACILLAESLIYSKATEVKHIKKVWEEIKGTEMKNVDLDEIPDIEAMILLHLHGTLYRRFLYHQCQTIEELRWCFYNVILNPEKYLFFNLERIPQVGATEKRDATTTKFVLE
jgi:serine/threonine protein kinase